MATFDNAGNRSRGVSPRAAAFLQSAESVYKKCPGVTMEALGRMTRVAILRQVLLGSARLSWGEARALGCPLLDCDLDQGVAVEPVDLAADVGVFEKEPGDDLGGLYQHLCEYSLRLFPGGRLDVNVGRTKRRERGLFFTPVWLADRVADQALEPLLKSPDFDPLDPPMSILDPACGSGRLLIACIQRLLSRQRAIERVDVTRRLIASAVRGIDCDPVAVALARTNMWLLADPSQGPVVGLEQAIVVGDAIVGPVHLDRSTDAFSWGWLLSAKRAAGGFGVIVSNPPFEVLTGFSSRPTLRAYAERVRRSGYQLAIGGNLNTARLFLERAIEVLANDGHLAFIMPYSFLMDRNAHRLRAHLMRHGWIEKIEAYPESSRVFGKVGQAVILLKIHKTVATKPRSVVKVDVAGEKASSTARLTLRTLATLDPVALPIPVAPAEVLQRAGRMHALNTSRVGQLAVGRVGEVDQTFYRRYMKSEPGEGQALLVRGAHLAPFSVALGADQTHERWLDVIGFMQKRHAGRFERDLRFPRVIQTGIVNLEARRRFVAAIVPAGVYLGNSVNYWVAHPQAGMPDEELNGYLLGLLNSAALEWRFRLTSSNHNINLYEVRSLPVPRLIDNLAPNERARFLDRARERIQSSDGDAAEVARRLVRGKGAPNRDDRTIARLIAQVAVMRSGEQRRQQAQFLETLLDHLIVWHLGMREEDLAQMLGYLPKR